MNHYKTIKKALIDAQKYATTDNPAPTQWKIVDRACDRALAALTALREMQGQQAQKLMRGDVRQHSDGTWWKCTDPDIGRWVCNGPDGQAFAPPQPAQPAQPAQQAQKPAAYGCRSADGVVRDCIGPDGLMEYETHYTIPLYTAPSRPLVQQALEVCIETRRFGDARAVALAIGVQSQLDNFLKDNP